jgi:hypothetical protein
MREGGRAGGRVDEQARSLSLSPSRTLVTPTASASLAQDNTSRGFPPMCSISRQPIWAGTRSDILLVGPGTPWGRNADKSAW